jgi:aspartyl-tRNA(Asn)/glutamyl-tRNA(Gln) amidotransferase subunit A
MLSLFATLDARASSDEVKRRFLGQLALSSGYYDAYYGKALLFKAKISEDYASIFDICDVILTPTALLLHTAL